MTKLEYKNKEKNEGKEELLGLLLLCIVIFITFMPIIFDYKELARWAQIILPIISAIYGLILICGLILFFIEKDISNNKSLFISLLIIILLYFSGLLGYINYQLWGKKEMIIRLSFSIFFIIGLINSAIKYAKDLSKEKPIRFLLTIAFLMAFVASLLYATYSKESIILYKIAVGIFYLFLLAHLVNSFILGEHRRVIENDKYKITKVMFFMLVLLTAIIMLPFYIKWCINNDINFNIILIIYASVISGSITLGGVAWTIKNQNEAKKTEQTQNAKPYLKLLGIDTDVKLTHIGLCDFDSLKELLIKKIFKNKKEIAHKVNKNLLNISSIVFKNTDNASFIFNGIIINKILYPINNKKIVEKNEYVSIDFNDYIAYEENLENLTIVIEDIYNNVYYVKTKLDLVKASNYFQTEIYDEKKSNYKKFKIDYQIYEYSIKELCLPELAPKEQL